MSDNSTEVQVKPSIDVLSKKIQDTTKEVNQLKNGLNVYSIEEQDRRLSDIEESILDCTQDLQQLESETLSETEKTELKNLKSKIEELKTSKEQLKQQIERETRSEIETLSQEVSQTQASQPSEQSEGKEKGRLGRQRDAITSKEEWKEHTGKNILRVVGGVGIVAGTVALCKRIFGGGDRETKIEGYDKMNRKQKRAARKKRRKEHRGDGSFRERPIGKVVKRGAMGLGIYGLGKYFGWRGKEGATGKDSDKDKLNGYENEIVNKPENKEKFENYESLGGKIDNVYQEIYGRELKSGYDDELEMEKISKEQSNGIKHYKGIVPYCLDNQFKNVEGILGQNSSFKTAMYEGLDAMVNLIKSVGANFLQLFAESYLENLPSWVPFKNMAGSLSDKIDAWKVKNENAEKEMQYFFRQSIRVQTYLFQKKNQLIKKIAKDASSKYGISEENIMDDKDNFEKYITKDPQYQNYLSSPTYSAVTVLDQNNIFDEHIDEDLKKHVVEIDEERDKILGCKKGEKDIIQKINEKKQSNEVLDTDDDKKLGEVCDGIVGDMDNIIEAAEESAWNIYGDLLRNGDSNLREYLEKSGLDKMFLSLKQILKEKTQLLKTGKLNNDEKITLAETLNSVLALKKEAKLGEFTIEQDYDEYGNIVYRIPGFLKGSMKNVYKGICKLIEGEWKEGAEYIYSGMLGTGVLISATGAVLLLSKTTHNAGKLVIKTGAVIATLPVAIPLKGLQFMAGRIKPVRDFGHKINPIKYKGEKGAEILMRDLLDGKVSLDRAGNIISRKTFGFFTSKGNETAWKQTFGVTNDLPKGYDMRKVAFDSIVKKQVNEYYLADIKNDSKLYNELVKNYDTSEEIRVAVKRQASLDELKKISKPISETVETVSDIRKAFIEEVKKAIDELAIKGYSKSSMVEIVSKNLKALMLDESLSDDEMECFTKFMRDGFDAKVIPEIKRLLASDTIINGEKIGKKLENLLIAGDYAQFRRILKNKKYGKSFEKIPVDDIIRSFDNVLKKAGGIGADTSKLLFKSFVKILARVL